MSSSQTVDQFIAKLDPWMQQKLQEVRRLLMTFPEIRERIRYGVPFYDYAGMMLYLGPYKQKLLMVGFCNGVHMNDLHGVLKADAGQTQIRHYELFKDRETDLEELAAYILEAMQTNIKLKKK